MDGRRSRAVWVVVAAAAIAIGAAAGACGGGGGTTQTGGGGASGANLSQRPQPAMPLFDGTRLHDVSLTLSADDWQSIINDTQGDTWRHATVSYDGVMLEEVGVRPAGESSRFAGNQKMSIRIKFDAFSGRGKFAGYKTVNVKGEYDDGSMMRERLALSVFAALMPAPQAAHTTLTVNGESRGVFTLREDWDETSIKAHFSEPFGPLYRLRPYNEMEDPYVYTTDDLGTYVPHPWEPHINKPSRGDDVILPFLKAIAANPSPLDSVADVDDLLAYLSACAIAMCTDGLVGNTGAQDHFEYFDPQSGKFFVLPWDPDNTWGSAGEVPTRSITSKLGRNAYVRVVSGQSHYQDLYRMKLAASIAAVPLATVQATADNIYAQIKDAAHADSIKMFSSDTFDWNLTNIKDFAAARYASVQQQLGM